MTDLSKMVELLEEQGIPHVVTGTETGYTDILVGTYSEDDYDRIVTLTYKDDHFSYSG